MLFGRCFCSVGQNAKQWKFKCCWLRRCLSITSDSIWWNLDLRFPSHRDLEKSPKSFDEFRDSQHLSDFQNMSEIRRCRMRLKVMYTQKTKKHWKWLTLVENPMDFGGFQVCWIYPHGTRRSVMRSILVLHLIWSASPRWTRTFPHKKTDVDVGVQVRSTSLPCCFFLNV